MREPLADGIIQAMRPRKRQMIQTLMDLSGSFIWVL